MTRTRSTTCSVLVLFAGLLLGSAACSHEVIYANGVPADDDSEPGSGGSGVGGSGAGGSGAGGSNTGGAQQPYNAMAIRVGDLEEFSSTSAVANTTINTAGSGGGGTVLGDPDALRVTLSDKPLQCQDPYSEWNCEGFWEVSFTLPPAWQQPGVYWLKQLNGHAAFEEASRDGICPAGFGSFFEGTVEVVSIDDTTIEVVLADTAEWLDEQLADVDGAYSVLRCASN